MLKRILLGQVRHLLGAGGSGFTTYLLMHGGSTSDIEAIVSGIVALVSFAWSAYDKYKSERKENA